MKLIVATLVLVSLVLSSGFLQFTMAVTPQTTTTAPPTTAPGFCDSKCQARCAKAGLQKRCLKYCGICCRECNCVPSGTYGHKSECPCYANKKNSKGQPKCP